ncbi:MAG: acetylornithine/N-succinyldiaminopimelate aminotransferase [Gammaproteobacteria bacterium]|jgi:acetylornithine/N-succinyldiaminopimelate aminotransferase
MSDTVMGTYNRLPIAFESGSGAWLTDINGKRYLDALAGIAVCGLGHAHPQITEVLTKQIGTLIHTSNLYEVPLQEKLANELCKLSGLDKVFFCNSGAEANEAAIKICRRYGHQRGHSTPLIVVMHNGFHGRTLATLTATGNSKIKIGFEPLVEGFLHIPYNDINALEQIFVNHNEIDAVMLEPIQGEGGVIVPTPGYLKRIASICEKNGALLVVDEIQTGLCRTGKWFAYQHELIKPDVVTLAKSLGNGVPIGACIASTRAAEPMTAGSHGSTFGGNPLAASAAIAVIDFLQQHNMDIRAAQIGQKLLHQFKQNLAGSEGVVRISGMGLMIGIELDRSCAEIVKMALKKNILINVTAERVIRLLPPLIITDEEAELIVKTVTGLIIEFLEE